MIFVVVALGLLGFGGFAYFTTNRRMRAWEHTTGRVVDFVFSSDSDGGTITMPVVEYETADGKVVRARPYQERSTDVDVDNYRIGDEVEVIYNPDNPKDMFLNDFMHVRFVPALTGGMGALFGCIGGVWCLGALVGALRRSAMPVDVPRPPQGPVINI